MKRLFSLLTVISLLFSLPAFAGYPSCPSFNARPYSSGGGITDLDISALTIGAVADKNAGQLTTTYSITANPVNLLNTSSDLVYLVRGQIVTVSQTNITSVSVAYESFVTAVNAMVIRPGQDRDITGSFLATAVTGFTASGAGNGTYNGTYAVRAFSNPPIFDKVGLPGVGAYRDGDRHGFGVYVEDGPYAAYMTDADEDNITPVGLDFIIATAPPMIGEMYAPYEGTAPPPVISSPTGPSSGSASGTYRYQLDIIAILESDYDDYELSQFTNTDLHSYVKTSQVLNSEEFVVDATIYP